MYTLELVVEEFKGEYHKKEQVRDRGAKSAMLICNEDETGTQVMYTSISGERPKFQAAKGREQK